MKAAVRTKYGPPESIRITNITKPVPKKNELLIRVHASSVNRTDSGFLRAKPWVVRLFSGLLRPKATVLGCDFAGVVEAVGDEVGTFAVSDRVFGFDDAGFGGHGEYMTIRADKAIARIPEGVVFEVAAAATEGGHYALSYVRSIGISGSSRVLVNGGTGAIGSAGIQIIKSMGAYVVATAPTDQVDIVKRLGADVVIDYQKQDFTQIDDRFDAVFDSVGKSTFGVCKRLLKPKGVYSSSELGPYGQNPILALCRPFMRGKKVLFPIPKNTSEIIGYLAGLLESGEFKPLIDSTHSLDDIHAAYTRVESGQKNGTVVISYL